MNRTTSLVLVPLALLMALGCSGKSDAPAGRGSGAPVFPVETMTVRSRPLQVTVHAVGSVTAFEEVSVTARVAGVVEQVRFMEGDSVGAGQVLAVIEPERHRAQFLAAEAALKQAAAMRDEAAQAWQRRAGLAETNPDLVREEELQAFRTKAAAAEAETMKAKAAHDLAALNLRDASVRTPAAGIVQARLVHTGQYVQPGTAIARLLREDPLLLRFEVAEAEARDLRRDAAVSFTSGGREYAATILHIAGSANAARMVPVVARVEGGTADLRPGAFANVRIVTDVNRDAVVIPQIAVRPSAAGLIAFVVEDGKAVRRTVVSGMRTPEGLLEIREGLRPGEQLVLRGADALREGVAVRVAEASAGEGRPVTAPAPQTAETR